MDKGKAPQTRQGQEVHVIGELLMELETKQTELVNVASNIYKELADKATNIKDHVCDDGESETRQSVSESILNKEDILSNVVEKLLKGYRILDIEDNIEHYVRASLRKGFIKVEQQNKNLVSLQCETWNEDGTPIESNVDTYHYTLPRSWYANHELSRFIILSLSKRKGITGKHLATFAKTYLSGKTQDEIAKELDVDLRTVKRYRSKIDSLIVSMPLKGMQGKLYNGSNAQKADCWRVHYDDTPSQAVYNDCPIEFNQDKGYPDYKPTFHKSALTFKRKNRFIEHYVDMVPVYKPRYSTEYSDTLADRRTITKPKAKGQNVSDYIEREYKVFVSNGVTTA